MKRVSKERASPRDEVSATSTFATLASGSEDQGSVRQRSARLMVTHTSAAGTRRPPVPGARILVVEARFYGDLADELLRGTLEVIAAAQATADVLTVDGARDPPPPRSRSRPRSGQAAPSMPSWPSVA